MKPGRNQFFRITTILLGLLSAVAIVAAANHFFQGTVSCESNDMHRKECRIDTRGGVRLARQKSDSPCIQGRTWGYDRNGIWVDRGCRAEFEVGRGGEGQYGYRGNRGESHGNRGEYGYGNRMITCESNDNRRNQCRVDTTGGVRMLRQKSDAACVQGRTWGYTRNAIWVDHGCRAEFQIGR